MLWLYLLGAVTVLAIALRRVLRRQTPLFDEIYSTRVAFDHLQSGVAWVRNDLCLGAVNSSLAATLGVDRKSLVGKDWLEIFPKQEWGHVREAYRRMLLLGMIEFETHRQRADGTPIWFNLLLVAVHDHRMRFVGHHCLVLDVTHVRVLERQVKEMAERLKELEHCSISAK